MRTRARPTRRNGAATQNECDKLINAGKSYLSAIFPVLRNIGNGLKTWHNLRDEFIERMISGFAGIPPDAQPIRIANLLNKNGDITDHFQEFSALALIKLQEAANCLLGGDDYRARTA
ncbi:hypothetical protein P3W23_09215 [Luteibacter sp. PPL554]